MASNCVYLVTDDFWASWLSSHGPLVRDEGALMGSQNVGSSGNIKTQARNTRTQEGIFLSYSDYILGIPSFGVPNPLPLQDNSFPQQLPGDRFSQLVVTARLGGISEGAYVSFAAGLGLEAL